MFATNILKEYLMLKLKGGYYPPSKKMKKNLNKNISDI